jgi:hypothetical protein
VPKFNKIKIFRLFFLDLKNNFYYNNNNFLKDFKMSKLVVIKNELFKDFVKIVSTDDLEKTLDAPEVPIPYELLLSADNSNSNLLMKEIQGFFLAEKIKNKEFFKLDESQYNNLTFMMNLVNLSGQGVVESSNVVEKIVEIEKIVEKIVEVEKPVDRIVEIEKIVEKIVEVEKPVDRIVEVEKIVEKIVEVEKPVDRIVEVEKIVDRIVEVEKVVEKIVEVEKVVEKIVEVEKSEKENQLLNNLVEEDPFVNVLIENKTTEVIESSNILQDVKDESIAEIISDDPFAIKVENDEQILASSLADRVADEVLELEMIDSLGIAKGSEIKLVKSKTITAKILNENEVEFDGEIMTILEATKQGFKKAKILGLAGGLVSWEYEGESLKSRKDRISG